MYLNIYIRSRCKVKTMFLEKPKHLIIYSLCLKINQFLEFVPIKLDFIEMSGNIYGINLTHYENIFYGKSNDISLIS